jgi:SCP-2 sterol transfer family
MTGPTTEFFEGLDERGHEPLLKSTSGTLRVDVENGKNVEHWFVAVEAGDITITHDDAEADASIRTSREVLDGITSGRVNAMAALLRGVVIPSGDLRLLLTFQRLFPGPPKSSKKAATTGRRSR